MFASEMKAKDFAKWSTTCCEIELHIIHHISVLVYFTDSRVVKYDVAVCITLKSEKKTHITRRVFLRYFKIFFIMQSLHLKRTELHIVSDITNIFPAESVDGKKLLWSSILNSVRLLVENVYHREQYLCEETKRILWLPAMCDTCENTHIYLRRMW